MDDDLTCIFRILTIMEKQKLFIIQRMIRAISESKTIKFDTSNDNPVICQYSIFEKANECGINDCVDTRSPVGRIICHIQEYRFTFIKRKGDVFNLLVQVALIRGQK